MCGRYTLAVSPRKLASGSRTASARTSFDGQLYNLRHRKNADCEAGKGGRGDIFGSVGPDP